MLRTLAGLAMGKRLPITEGTLRVAGASAPVVIRRDANGVAYVEARTDDDAFYGVGFCHGQDRAFQLEVYLRIAHGTMSELVGDEMLEVDRLSRRIGFVHVAKAQLAASPAHTRAQMAAYARGVNDGARVGLRKKPHELALLGAEPSTFEAYDVLAVLQFFAFGLSSNWDAELARLAVLREDGPDALAALEAANPAWLEADGASRLHADIAVLAHAQKLALAATTAVRTAGLGGASNNWALAPSRTKTGRALLACDPHLAPTLPSPWYLIHVRTPTWAMTGATLPSQPIASFGHTDHVAWGLTAGHADNTDLFLEEVSADGRVREGYSWAPCEVREEIIHVKGKPDVRERVLVTKRGPIVSPALGGAKVALSMRATWMAARAISGYDAYRAKDVAELRRAFVSYPATSENRVFADTGGHIAYQMVGDVPVRRKGHGMLPMPGWDPEVGWEDEPLPFEALPRTIDPPSGFVASANQKPAQDAGAPFLGADWLDGHRHARIVEVLATRSDWDVASAMQLQLDRTSLVWRSLRERVLDALHAHRRVDAADALALLAAWDGQVAGDSEGAAVFELFFSHMMQRAARAKAPRAWRSAIGEGTNVVLEHGMMALRRIEHLARLMREQPDGWFPRGWAWEMADALAAAERTLRKVAGPPSERWAWGRVRPLVLVHPFGTKRPMDRIFNLGPLAFGGDATTIPQASVDFGRPLHNAIGIPNMRMVVDVGAWEKSRWVIAGGQSGNPMSAHYADMLGPWMRGDGVAIGWSPEDVERAAVARLELLPR